MSAAPANIHATAIVIGRRGLLFVGPSGAGKSMMAFNCLAIARRQGVRQALIADDQVLLTREGERISAACPPQIAGMMELRGSGIVRMDHISSALIDLVIEVVSPGDCERLPPADERFGIDAIGDLPMIRISSAAADPLAVVGAVLHEWRAEAPFW